MPKKPFSKNYYQEILDILEDHVDHTYIYGSRARGTHHTFSDLDLYITSPISDAVLADLRASFDESSLPFKVSLLISHDCSKDFKNLISKDFLPLKEIF